MIHFLYLPSQVNVLFKLTGHLGATVCGYFSAEFFKFRLKDTLTCDGLYSKCISYYIPLTVSTRCVANGARTDWR